MKHIAVLGAGTMGQGIARFFASKGYPVFLYEADQATLQRLMQQWPATEGSTYLDIRPSGDLRESVETADLIIESIPEKMELKRELFGRLAGLVGDEAIIATNTSTFRLAALAEGMPYANRMLSTNYTNPADLVPLVEVVHLPSTPPLIVDRVVQFLRNCGKEPVVLKHDIPGFIANRLQTALMREACYLLEQGIADAKQIDATVKHGLGLRYAFKGPFEIADLGGLDVWSKVTGYLFPELAATAEPPSIMLDKVKRGELGVKSGEGYYVYKDASAVQKEMQDNLSQLLALKYGKQPEGPGKA